MKIIEVKTAKIEEYMNLAFIEECIEVNNKLSFFHVKQDCECRFHSNIGCGCYPKTSTNPNARCYPIPSSGSGGISLPGLLANPSKHYNSWTLKSNLDLFCSLQVVTYLSTTMATDQKFRNKKIIAI